MFGRLSPVALWAMLGAVCAIWFCLIAGRGRGAAGRMARAAAGAALFLLLAWRLPVWLPGSLERLSKALSPAAPSVERAASVASAAGTLFVGALVALVSRGRRKSSSAVGRNELPLPRPFDVVNAERLSPLLDGRSVRAAVPAAPLQSDRCPHCGQWMPGDPPRAAAAVSASPAGVDREFRGAAHAP